MLCSGRCEKKGGSKRVSNLIYAAQPGLASWEVGPNLAWPVAWSSVRSRLHLPRHLQGQLFSARSWEGRFLTSQLLLHQS